MIQENDVIVRVVPLAYTQTGKPRVDLFHTLKEAVGHDPGTHLYAQYFQGTPVPIGEVELAFKGFTKEELKEELSGQIADINTTILNLVADQRVLTDKLNSLNTKEKT